MLWVSIFLCLWLFVSILQTIFTSNSSHSLLMSFIPHKMYDCPHCVQVSDKVHPFNLLCCFSLIFTQISTFFFKESFRRLTSGMCLPSEVDVFMFCYRISCWIWRLNAILHIYFILFPLASFIHVYFFIAIELSVLYIVQIKKRNMHAKSFMSIQIICGIKFFKVQKIHPRYSLGEFF